jgi:hypothetical protein
MPQEFRKTMKLTQGYIRTRVSGNLTAMIWKDKRHVNMLINMHHPPAEGNFHDEHGNTSKSLIIQDYNQHMGYVDKSDCMTNILHQQMDMEVDKETLLPPPRPDSIEQLHYPPLLRFKTVP